MAHTILCAALAKQGKFDEAVAEGRQAIRISSDSYQHEILGFALAKQGKLDEAMAEWREAIRLHPEGPTAHVQLGEALKVKGDLDGAIAEFREAWRVRPGWGGPNLQRFYDERGRALRAKRDLDGALAAFQDALRYGPDREALDSLMAILKAKKNPVDGLPFFDSLIRDQPGKALGWRARARYLVELGRLAEAEADLATAVRDWPENPLVWADRGRFEAMRGRLDEAATDYARALALSPAPVNPWSKLDQAGVYAEAVANPEVLERLVRLQPENRALLIARFLYLSGRREWKAAAEVLARLNTLEPPDPSKMQREADLRSWLEDRAGYRRVCREMLERFGSTSDPVVARSTLFSCLIEGDAIPDRRVLAPLLDQIRADPKGQAWARIAEGLHEHRAGRYAAALDSVGPLSEVKAPSSNVNMAVLGCMIRALAHARLGQVAEARRQLATAEATLNQAPSGFDPSSEDPLPANWNLWLRNYTLRREAEGLLR